MNASKSLAMIVAAGVLMTAGVAIADPMGTAFTYQGRLTAGSSPADGHYDFQFTLCRNSTCDDPVGVVAIANHAVIRGLFTVDLDFGDDAFDGTARWLEIGVRPRGAGPYEILDPPQKLTPTPHALALPGLWTQQREESPNIIGGHTINVVTPGVVGATIGGGGSIIEDEEEGPFYEPNRVTDVYGTVGGGFGNIAGDDAGTTDDAGNATVGGGSDNTASGGGATVGGGWMNNASGHFSTVGGGESNTASAWRATVAGGQTNTASGDNATVGGGWGNDASGPEATVGGGTVNTASGTNATVAGGLGNRASGDYAFAAGRYAEASHNGSFVWADSTGPAFTSMGPDQFLIRATGGVGIGTTTPSEQLSVAGVVESSSGGFKFPDGTIQTTAGALPGEGNTLDEAYDQGGPGAGRTIIADAGPVNIEGPDGLTVLGNVEIGTEQTPVLSIFRGDIFAGSGEITLNSPINSLNNIHTSQKISSGSLEVYGGGLDSISSTSDSLALIIEPGLPALRLESDPTGVDPRPNIIGGHYANEVKAGAFSATIGGGGWWLEENRVTDHYGAVGGGSSNVAGDDDETFDNAAWATVGGGAENTAPAIYATVAGGYSNTASGERATVAGGGQHTASGSYATVSGGQANTASGWSATVGGGITNYATGSEATVGGGGMNQATKQYATAGGGK